MKRTAMWASVAVWAAIVTAATAIGADPVSIAPFSTAQPGPSLPAGWQVLAVRHEKLPRFEVVREGERSVLRIHADDAVGSAAHVLDADPRANPMLTWHWKIDHALEKANLAAKDGDDFAARVYVSFDVPLAQLSFAARAKLRIARLVYGPDLPTAAICYVWDNRHPIGTSAWNVYTDRVRIVVLESGNAKAGQWVREARDVDADFQAAFGAVHKGPTPHVTGVAVSSDTDQTRESVTAWFDDLRLEPRP